MAIRQLRPVCSTRCSSSRLSTTVKPIALGASSATCRAPRSVKTLNWVQPLSHTRAQAPSSITPGAVQAPDSADLGRVKSGTADTVDDVLKACCMERIATWCSIDSVQEVQAGLAYYTVKGAPWRMAVAGSVVSSAQDSSPSLVLSFAVHSPDIIASDDMAGASSSEQLSGLLLHWGCSERANKWQPPPPGWHTMPAVSYDAGGGAWQTPFTYRRVSDLPGSVHVTLLHLPLKGALQSGGVCCVLKTAAGQWLQDGSTNKDFFVSSASLSSGQGTLVAATPEALKRPPPSNDRPAAAAAGAPSPQVQESWQQAPEKKVDSRGLSQEERNRQELPDITKGVPWQPHQAPQAQQVHHRVVLPPRDLSAESDAGNPWATAAGLLGDVDEKTVKAFVESFVPSRTGVWTTLQEASAAQGTDSQGPSTGVCAWMVDAIASQEKQAERSLMHRFNTAHDLVEQAGKAQDTDQALTAVLMWLRLSAARHLTWNRNYNVKPREISAAQDKLNSALAIMFEEHPRLRQVVVPAMAAAGRGGSSDVGQRIRDEILSVQSRNGCKGGMMEEWHQKLHNNTSPDDVVICQALIAMLEEGLDVRAYWRTLHGSGITAQRLASFDRAIRSEPRFSPQQIPGLLADLRAYLQTLQAVHSGADLGSAAGSVLGFSQKSMKGKLVTVDPVQGVASPELRQLLLAILYQQHRTAAASGTASEVSYSQSMGGSIDEDIGGLGSSRAAVAAAVLMLQLVLEARHLLRPIIQAGNAACGGRLRDVLFLDMALDCTARTALETVMSHVRAEATAAISAPGAGDDAAGGTTPAGLLGALRVVRWAVENAALSSEQLHQQGITEDLCMALKWLDALGRKQGEDMDRRDWALQVVAVVDRLKRSLSDQAHQVIGWLQPTALALGTHLAVPKAASCLMCEDAARGTSVAPVAQLLAAVEPSVRRMGGQGAWQVISRGHEQGPVQGLLRVESSLVTVQYETCSEPTVLIVDHVSGHEEVPEGAVAVLTSGDCPDVLSHSAVRARNMGVLMAACLSTEEIAALKELANSHVAVSLVGSEVKVQKMP